MKGDHVDPYDRILETVQAERAPARLREHVAAEHDRTLVRRMVVKRMKLTGVLMAGAAALGIAVGLAASGGGSGAAPAPLEAAAPGALASTEAAPAVRGDTLNASVDGVAFPRWPGWAATGQRTDVVSGRDTRTVFYERGGSRVGYTIVSGAPLEWPDGARRTTAGGTEVRVVKRAGRTFVFWRQGGRTCIVSAPADVPEQGLLELVDYA